VTIPCAAGMLWAGERPEVRALEENMAAYFNMFPMEVQWMQGVLCLPAYMHP
jgi:hypothetical protein